MKDGNLLEYVMRKKDHVKEVKICSLHRNRASNLTNKIISENIGPILPRYL